MNRRHIWRGLYLPAVGVPGPEHIVVAVDTSGSMSREELVQVFAEINRLRAQSECRLTLIQCDAAIQTVDEFTPWEDCTASGKGHEEYQITGRGGTDLRLPFRWVQRHVEEDGQMPPDVIVYLTDGYGPFPEMPPPYPVVWIVTRSGIENDAFPFGTVIRLV